MTTQHKLQPLGVFAAVGFDENQAIIRPLLKSIAHAVPDADRTKICAYLRNGACIDAWMESTVDIVGERFRTPGGSAIHSDGTWFWRYDTADYVEHYGVSLPTDFLRTVKESEGTAPTLTNERQLEIFNDLRQFYDSNSSTDIFRSAAESHISGPQNENPT